MDKYIEDALNRIKQDLPDCEVEYHKVKKNNNVMLDGFIIREKGNNIAPTFYLSKDDRERLSPEEFADQTVRHFQLERERGIDFDIADFTDVEWAKSRMLFDIVNRNRNKGTNLVNIPITQDLMITFKVSVDHNASIRVTNDHLHLWGDITAEELLEAAQKNAVIMDKAVFKSINDVLVDMYLESYKTSHPNVDEDELRQRLKTEMFGDMDCMLYVLTTQRQSNAAMLYPELLQSIRDQWKDDIVILPSSTHEVLLLKAADCKNFESLKSIVREVNRDVVMQDNESDYLSDELLFFDGELKQIDDLEYFIDDISA